MEENNKGIKKLNKEKIIATHSRTTNKNQWSEKMLID